MPAPLAAARALFVASLIVASVPASVPAATGPSPVAPADPVSDPGAAPGADARIDVNSASAATLADRLPGIGAVKAAAIVAYREAHGPFASTDALIEVRGIGPKTLDRLRPLLGVGPERERGRRDAERRTRVAIGRVLETVRRDAVGREGAGRDGVARDGVGAGWATVRASEVRARRAAPQ